MKYNESAIRSDRQGIVGGLAMVLELVIAGGPVPEFLPYAVVAFFVLLVVARTVLRVAIVIMSTKAEIQGTLPVGEYVALMMILLIEDSYREVGE